MRQSTENRKMQTRRKAKYYIIGKLYTLFVAVGYLRAGMNIHILPQTQYSGCSHIQRKQEMIFSLAV